VSDLQTTGALALAPSPIRTADELAAAFLLGYGPATRAAYARDLKAWGAWLEARGIGVLEAHRAHVELWARQAEGSRAPATIARALAALSSFYDYALDTTMPSTRA
jgi:site-specific recombinase XerD